MKGFELHPQLAADCLDIGALTLCRLLLRLDARYPWFILVPQRPDITEIHHLSPPERARLIEEAALLGQCLAEAYHPDKLNIAALGNQVPQLHVHHIVRYRTDPAWPHPVWGHLPPQPYKEGEAEARAAEMRLLLTDHFR